MKIINKTSKRETEEKKGQQVMYLKLTSFQYWQKKTRHISTVCNRITK